MQLYEKHAPDNPYIAYILTAQGDAYLYARRFRDAEKAKKDLQLSVYALAAREVFDWNLARLTFYNLLSNEAVSAVRDDKKLNKVRAQIQEAAADIRAGKFPPNPGFSCKFCDFESICPAREQGAAASTSDEE